jgi:hypothetical protein
MNGIVPLFTAEAEGQADEDVAWTRQTAGSVGKRGTRSSSVVVAIDQVVDADVALESTRIWRPPLTPPEPEAADLEGPAAALVLGD